MLLEQSGVSNWNKFKMNEIKASQTVSNIDRYRRARQELERVLSVNSDHNTASSMELVRYAETALEEAFSVFLSTPPNQISEVVLKSQVIIDEIGSSAELANYHKQGLQSIVSDLINLADKMENKRD